MAGALFNRIKTGEHMPKSFVEGFIIPTRKNGGSDNALDYRSITLLSSCYTVFAKVQANRVQDGLQHLIGDSQQGFVTSRQLQRSVVMMQAVMHQA